MRRLPLLVLLACLAALPAIGAATADAPAILLAKVYAAKVDPADYWVSEKYDGVRAIWDGRDLRFRSGHRVAAPQWFIDGLPSQALDGELWLGRGRFEELVGIVRKSEPVDEEWRRVNYMIFELPGAPGSFTERIVAMQAAVATARLPGLKAVEQFRIADRRLLARKFDEIVKAGGEGLMLHRADATYRTGRHDDLLKLKPLQDAEARVVGHEAGRGRLRGLTGALRMAMPDGRTFRLGSGLSDELRRNPPPLGAVVTYRYQELTAQGLPRFPRYWRLREEL